MTENMLDVKTIILLKQYVKNLASGVKDGLSAYEIAKKNGFTGTEEEWLDSLKPQMPSIGADGHWYIGDIDTGVEATVEIPKNISYFFNDVGYLTAADIIENEPIPDEQIHSLFD